MRLSSYFCWKAWSLHVSVSSLLAGPELSSPSAQDFFVPVCWGVWPSQIALSSPKAHGCIQHSLFRSFLEEGEKVPIACFPLFFSEMYHLAFTEKESEVPAWCRGLCSPWYICNLQRVYVYSKEWVQSSSKKPKNGSTCRNDEQQIANRIQQCKAVVVTDPRGFIVEL